MANDRGSLVVGLHTPQAKPDASQLLNEAREDGYDFITTTLPCTEEPRPDVTQLVGRWWRTSIVGIVPETPTPDILLTRLSPQIDWAMHMGIPAVILPPIPSKEVLIEYARKVNSLALEAQSNNVQLWIKVNLSESALADYSLFHRLCDGLGNIGIMLVMEVMPTMQSAAATVASQLVLLHKAIGANLKAICFPTKVFLTNKRGYPTLAKSHQVIFTEALKRIGRTVRVMVEGPAVHDIPAGGEGQGATRCLPYLQYIRHMRQRPECVEVLDSDEANLERAYLDSLQRPLQPLKDHLEFSMYETFEKDPVKYTKYQEAVYLALKDGLGPLGGPAAAAGPKLVTIAVVGAGRGPLVMRSIHAFKQLKAPPGTVVLKVYAVEKNPSAVVYLQSMARHHAEWAGVVTVIKEDARNLTRVSLEGHQIDIIVSELLGSFGDNELSPECLDPILASSCCKPSTISIPMQYTSYLAPVSSVRLHTEAKQQAQVPHEGAQPLGLQRAMETAYVVRTHAASQTHAEQPCWTFNHPPRFPNKERAAHLEFAPDPTFAAATGSGYGAIDPAIASIVSETPAGVSGPVTIHGLLGSFTAVLYAHGDAMCDISIAPHRFSKDMFSWFPIYFPFLKPLQVPAHCNVSVSMWRKTADGRVWYEWCARVHRKGEVIDMTTIHNTNGRSSYVSM